MTRSPNFTDPQFLDAVGVGGLNAAFGTVSGAITAVGSGIWAAPGLIAPESIVFSFSGMVATAVMASSFAVVASDGTVVRAHGTQTGQDTQSTATNFTSLIPGGGSRTAYLAATVSAIQQNPFPIPGPPQGHPSYNPNYTPTIGYATNLSTLTLAAVTGAPDNITSFELFRTTLSAGQSAISVINTVGWRRATDRKAAPPLILTSGSALSSQQGQYVISPATPGLTHTMPPSSGAGGLVYMLVNSTSGNWTIAAPGTDRIVGLAAAQLASTIIPASGSMTLWGNAAAGAWDVMACSLNMAPGRLLNIQVFNAVGTSVYTPTPGTNSVIFEVQAGGGGGGGCQPTGAGNGAAGIPGGAGAYAMVRYTSGFSSSSITVGAGGAGGVGGGGISGGNSFVTGLINCPGGPGGATSQVVNIQIVGGQGSTPVPAITGGLTLMNGLSDAGTMSIVEPGNASSSFGGAGGRSKFGGGPPATTNNANGLSGVSYGTGGSAAVATNTTGTLNGGAGAAGIVIVWEYS